MPKDKQKHLLAVLALSLLVGRLFSPIVGLATVAGGALGAVILHAAR